VGAGVRAATFTIDGKSLLVATPGELNAWDLDAEKPRRIHTDAKNEFNALYPLPDGRTVLLNPDSNAGNRPMLVDLVTGKDKLSDQAPTTMLSNLAYAPGGKELATISGEVAAPLRRWEAATGRELGRLGGLPRATAGGRCQKTVGSLFWPMP